MTQRFIVRWNSNILPSSNECLHDIFESLLHHQHLVKALKFNYIIKQLLRLPRVNCHEFAKLESVFLVFLISPRSDDKWMLPFDVTRVHFALQTRAGAQAWTIVLHHEVFETFDVHGWLAQRWKDGDSEAKRKGCQCRRHCDDARGILALASGMVTGNR